MTVSSDASENTPGHQLSNFLWSPREQPMCVSSLISLIKFAHHVPMTHISEKYGILKTFKPIAILNNV